MAYDNKYQVQFEVNTISLENNASKEQKENKDDKVEQDENANVIRDKKLQHHINKYNLERKNIDEPITKEDLLQVKSLIYRLKT